MNRYRGYLLAITGSAILAVVATSNTLAGPGRITSSQSAQKQSAQKQSAQNNAQPFHSEITATANLTPSSNPCVIYNVAPGKGVVNIGSDSIDVSFEAVDELLRNPFCFGASRQPEEIGYHFWTAPNGDKLVGNVHVFQQSGGPGAGALWTGTFNLTNGTGQFAGAEGDGTFTVTFPPGSRTATAVYDGEITLHPVGD